MRALDMMTETPRRSFQEPGIFECEHRGLSHVDVQPWRRAGLPGSFTAMSVCVSLLILIAATILETSSPSRSTFAETHKGRTMTSARLDGSHRRVPLRVTMGTHHLKFKFSKMAPCPFTLAISNNVVAAALCSPHLLYAFIWNFPKQWQRMFGRWSVQIFESLVRPRKEQTADPLPQRAPLTLPALADTSLYDTRLFIC
jgi:hypothetical protein